MDAEIITALIGALSAILAAIVAYISVRESTRQEQDTRARVTEAESRVEAQPERAKPTWDLARVTLDAYFNRNLTQINAIFWLSVVVMLVGFLERLTKPFDEF